MEVLYSLTLRLLLIKCQLKTVIKNDNFSPVGTGHYSQGEVLELKTAKSLTSNITVTGGFKGAWTAVLSVPVKERKQKIILFDKIFTFSRFSYIIELNLFPIKSDQSFGTAVQAVFYQSFGKIQPVKLNYCITWIVYWILNFYLKLE